MKQNASYSHIKKCLKPSYYDSFFCLGSDCVYDCCRIWDITLTRKEYNSLKSNQYCMNLIKNGVQVVKRIRKDATDLVYAKLCLNENGKCTLQNKEGLCSLQLNCGHGALPQICRSFPRSVRIYGDSMHLSLSLGCEKVLDLLMEHPAGIAFTMEGAAPESCPTVVSSITGQELESRPIYQYANEISIFAQAILQTSGYSLTDRLLFLGAAMEKLSKMEEDLKIPEILSFLKGAADEFQGEFVEKMEQIKGQKEMQALNGALMMELFFNNKENSKFVDRVNSGLGVTFNAGNWTMSEDGDGLPKLQVDLSNVGFHIDRERFSLAEDRFKRFLNGREYIMENICACWFWSLGFPFYLRDKSIWENYILFVALFGMLRLLIMGYLDQENSMEDFRYAVTLCSRSLIHNQLRANNILNYLLKNQVDTLAHMAILLK